MSDEPRPREELVQEANLARWRLTRTVARLDRRWHDAFDLRGQIKRHAAEIAVAAGLIGLAACVAVGVAVHRVASAVQRRRRARWRLATTAWRHPDRALRAQRRPFLVEIARSLLLAVATTALTVPARRAARPRTRLSARRIATDR